MTQFIHAAASDVYMTADIFAVAIFLVIAIGGIGYSLVNAIKTRIGDFH